MAAFQTILTNVYLFADTCNTYLVTDGERALVIDCGGGDVVDHLHEIGVSQIEWCLFTHHHRDQCFGAGRLIESGTRLAVPRHERFLFERAGDYWQQKRVYDNFNDRSTFFTIGENLPVADTLADYEQFAWGPYSFFILPSPGHTLGSISLIASLDDQTIAFTGDLMHDGGKLYQLHAMEYEYGDLIGANWTAESMHALRKRNIDLALPSHGPPITEPEACIDRLDARLHRLMDLQRDRLAGTAEGKFAHEIKMEQITPHLLWGTAQTCSNFFVIKAESGKALLIDYPYSSAPLFLQALHTAEPFVGLRFTEHHLDELRDEWGITDFDVVIATHIHDDHVCGIPYLKRFHGTECWTLEDVAKVIEAPEKWNTPCIMAEPIEVDRRFRDGDRFEWEGIPFEIVFYPGQTEFHAAILAELDGRRILFSGDSSYPLKRYLPEKESEWMVNSVLRNSLTFAMHGKCANEFDRLRPDLLCPGHGPYYDVPEEAFAAHRQYVEQKEAVWRDLLPEPAELGIDLFWTRVIPYQITLSRGIAERVTVELRNSFDEEATFDVSLQSAVGLSIQPAQASLTLSASEQGTLEFEIFAAADAPVDRFRRHLLTAHVRVNDTPHGPISEALLVIAE